jgi:hypothetical protein
VSPARFFRQFPNEDLTVRLSPFIVMRPMGPKHNDEILAVNYVNGRFVRRPGEERSLLEELAKQPMGVPLSMTSLREKLEKLHRFGLVTV